MKIDSTRTDHSGNGRVAEDRSTPPDPWAQFRRELNRSRRYRHDLTLVWLGPRDDEEVIGEELLATVQSLTRDVDCCWIADGRMLVLLPESARTGAERLVSRLAGAEPKLLARLEVRIAAFPEDGLTSGALLDAVAGDRSSFKAAFDLRRPAHEEDGSTLVGRLLTRVRRESVPAGLPSESGL